MKLNSFKARECKFNKAKANDVVDRMLPSQRRCVTASKVVPLRPRLLTIFTSFSTRLFSPLNASFYMRSVFLLLWLFIFVREAVIIIKIRDRCFVFFNEIPFPPSRSFTLLSIPHNTRIKMVMGSGVNSACFASFSFFHMVLTWNLFVVCYI